MTVWVSREPTRVDKQQASQLKLSFHVLVHCFEETLRGDYPQTLRGRVSGFESVSHSPSVCVRFRFRVRKEFIPQ